MEGVTNANITPGQLHFCQLRAAVRIKAILRLLLFISGYNINCQYQVHFDAQIKEIRDKFGGLDAIPQDPFLPTIWFHLPAHTASC